MLNAYYAGQTDIVLADDHNEENTADYDQMKNIKKDQKKADSSDSNGTSEVTENTSESDGKSVVYDLQVKHTSSTTKVHPVLSSMVNYCTSVRFPGFDESEATNRCYQMSSFSETQGLSHLGSRSQELVLYNARQLSRIYPKGQRIDSSNYNPTVFWSAGCQLVSLNYQTPDEYFQLNQGRFMSNGRCGYVLKPKFMVETLKNQYDPFGERLIHQVLAASYEITIISGMWLGTTDNVYISMDLHGLPADCVTKFKTKKCKGPNPSWGINSQPFVLKKIIAPDLALLRIAVNDETSNKVLAQRSLPIEDLQCGYRHLPLTSTSCVPLRMSSLFIKVKATCFTKSEHSDFLECLTNPTTVSSRFNKRMEVLSNIGMDTEGIENNCPDEPLLKKKSKPQMKPSPWLDEDQKLERGSSGGPWVHRSMPESAKKSNVLDRMRKAVRKETISFQPIEMSFCCHTIDLHRFKQNIKFKNIASKYEKKMAKESTRTATRIKKMNAQGIVDGSDEMKEFLSSREKIKRIVKKNELTEKTELWNLLDQERVKMLKKHIIKKWNEDKKRLRKIIKANEAELSAEQEKMNFTKTTEMLEKSEDKSKKVKAKIMREVAAGNAEYFAQNIISMENIHNRYWEVFREAKEDDLAIIVAIRRREAEKFNEENAVTEDTVSSCINDLEDITIEE